MTTADQAKAVYLAEERLQRWLDREEPTIRVYGSTWLLEPEVHFADLASIQTYVDRVLAHIGWQEPCKVRPRRGQTKGHYEPATATIALPFVKRFALRETYVLHELAHHLTRHTRPAHDPTFARAEIFLHEALGYAVRARLLSIAFAEEGVVVQHDDNRFRRLA